MGIDLSLLLLGEEYDRPYLADIWGYQDWHAIGRGIVTPKDHNLIILFVTQEKQKSLTQYRDHFEGERLVMEGEAGHRTDRRLVDSINGPDHIHLFFRERHHRPFTYYGEVHLEDFKLRSDQPSIFYFNTSKSLALATSAILTEETATGNADESFVPDVEGRRRIQTHVRYERSRRNRARAIEIHGTVCNACGFDFNEFYGRDLARDFIEVHHLESVTSSTRTVDPEKDLIPLCANCHRMIHRSKGQIFHVDELIKAIRRAERRGKVG